MTAIEAINYFDQISSLPQQEAFKTSWWVMIIFIIATIIFWLINPYIENFIGKTDGKSIIDDWANKHPIKFKIIGISLLSIFIYDGQKVVQEFLYNRSSIVKKADVIDSEYFKNLDNHKKELMKLYLLCDNKANSQLSPKIDCSELNIDLKNFSIYISTRKLIEIIKTLDDSDNSKNDENTISDNFDGKKALIEYIKSAK